MIAEMRQAFGTGKPREETVFDVEFTEEHVIDGVFCQVQFEVRPRAGFDAVGVDWGDGEVMDWPATSRRMAHNWSDRGRFRVKLDARLGWFRLTTAYAVDEATGAVRAIVRPWIEPVQWGDFVESGEGTYCGWRGLRGTVPAWGRSMRDARCCYQQCFNLTGGFPKWGPSFTDCTAVYDGCAGLSGPLPPWPREAAACDQCFRGTGATGTIPAWPATMASARMCFKGCAGLTGAWTDDPALLMPDAMDGWQGTTTAHDEAVAEAGDGLRALFYADWGGTRARPGE